MQCSVLHCSLFTLRTSHFMLHVPCCTPAVHICCTPAGEDTAARHHHAGGQVLPAGTVLYCTILYHTASLLRVGLIVMGMNSLPTTLATAQRSFWFLLFVDWYPLVHIGFHYVLFLRANIYTHTHSHTPTHSHSHAHAVDVHMYMYTYISYPILSSY